MKNFTLFGQVYFSFFLRKLFTLFIMAGSISVSANTDIDSLSHHSADAQPFAIVFTQQPAASTVCEGSNASFSVLATGSGALSYQWQVSTNGGSTWSSISNGAGYSGATTAALQISNVPAALNANRYRCVVSDGSSGTSSSALLTVNAAPTVQPDNIAVQVCISGSATVTAATYAGINYQWQVNTGSGFTNVVNTGVYTGATTSMLRITGVPASMEGYLYRYIATNSTTGCTATSGIDTLHVLPYATILQQPLTTSVCPGADASFTVAATGASSIKWQVSTNGSTWTDVPDNATYSGSTDVTLNISGVAANMNNYRYRVVLYNALSCPVSSNIVFLMVRPVTVITAQPVSTTVCATNTATFRVTATGSSLTYQWQSDNGTNGATWTNITPGGTAATLTRSNVTMSMNGYRYRVIVNGFCGSLISSEATLQTQRGTWLGVTSTDWQTASNWCGGVPDNTTDVLIPAGAPNMPDIIYGIGYSRSITIETNARLTISGGTAQMSGPFSIQGTVAYTGTSDQQVLPAAHGSLEINGSGKKYLQTSTDVFQNLVLGGTAKLVTSDYILTMRAGSNPISGSNLSDNSTSWIITGNGNTGAANTGTGGLQYEEIKSQDGNVIFPVGPSDSGYNPLFLSNTGVRDRFLVAVNDQPIPGSYAGLTINRTWKVSEGTPGGSSVTLDMKWNKPEEQPLFDSSNVMMVRSASSMLVETKSVRTPNGRPFARASSSDFTSLTAFSLQTFISNGGVLPVKLLSFTAKKQGDNGYLNWNVKDEANGGLYVVQRSSVVNRSFADIGQLKREADKSQYQFMDNRMENGINYYRLKILNKDGSSEFSPVVSLVNEQGRSGFQLRPSVTSATTTNLFFSLERKQTLALSLSNAAGQLQWMKTIEAAAGNSIQSIDLSTLSKGIYFIQIRGSENEYQQLSLIKQ
jgi:hypothetical protein